MQLSDRKKIVQHESAKKIGYNEGYSVGYEAGLTAIKKKMNQQKNKFNKIINELQIQIASLTAKMVNWDTTNYLLNEASQRINILKQEYEQQYKNRFDCIYISLIYVYT